MKVAAAASASTLLLAGCGAERYDAPSAGADPSKSPSNSVGTDRPPRVVPDGYTGTLRGSFTVLESPDHGPQLCSSVMESLPPQCAGPDIAGWQWNDTVHESARGTIWGEFEVTGRYVDGVFTMTQPARPARYPSSSDDPEPTPCPEPAGGWKPVDPSKATEEGQTEAMRVARESGELGGVWISWLVPTSQLTEQNANDPALYVLNLSTTGDVAVMEQAVRQVWGGSLCVSAAERTEDELAEIANQVTDWPGVTSTSGDVVEGNVDVSVWVITQSLERRAVEEFGPGVIDFYGLLQPVEA